MSNKLPSDRLKELYETFVSAEPYGDWESRFVADLEWVQRLGADEFATREVQERLWKLHGASALGPGESVDVAGAYADEQIIAALESVRAAELPANVDDRVAFLQGAYDRILDLVHRKHSRQRPKAKLARVFTGLLPRETATLYNSTSMRRVNELVLGKGRLGALESTVRIRERLRSVLGEEAGTVENARRMMFCWWLSTQYEALAAGDALTEKSPALPARDTTAPPLDVWSIQKAQKGLTAVGGYLESWRAVVNAATNGASSDDIVATLGQVFELEKLNKLNAASRRMLFNEVRRYGFLKNENGLWFPSEDGLALVDDDPPDILVERFLVQSFGIAQVLRFLRGGPRTTREMCDELRRQYPAWGGDYGPTSQISWARALGLVDLVEKSTYALTEYGAYWEGRLPDELPSGEGLPTYDDEVEKSAGEPVEDFEPRRFEAVFGRLREMQPDFVLNESQARTLHVAWHAQPGKRFVILSGLSGTGKTALVCHYAEAYLALQGLSPDEHLAVVAVSPDWRDPTSLLGYFNALHAEPTWQQERALSLLLDASANPDKPYFLVLDEMNLAQVEHYFAPFLSAMETGRAIELHQSEQPVNGVPNRVRWPKNLFIAGTINMDETTQTVSDKVLDRAFTLEFWDVDLSAYLRERNVREDRKALLLDLHAILAKARRHFGYRTAGEVLNFIDHADAHDELFDHAVFAKVLPRIRGEDSPALRTALATAKERCQAAKLPKCAQKLEDMLHQLDATGVTRFWA